MIKVFISYSHKDEALRDALETHLSLLKHQGVIQVWHDRQIGAGEEFDSSINQNLDNTQIILLLISPDFLASPYCWGIEMMRAMERHEAGLSRVIPVILRTCDWRPSPLGKLLAAPKDGKPINLWPDIDEAFHDVARQIRAAAEVIAGTSDPAVPFHSARPPQARLNTRAANSLHTRPTIPKHAARMYCSRCGVFAGTQSRCTGPYTHHAFTKSGDWGAYCSRCGVSAGMQSACKGPYTHHEFTNASEWGNYCSRCGASAGTQSRCTGPYTHHDFTTG